MELIQHFLLQIIQNASEGAEVVFQCRDEGPIRSKVHWTRANGRPLPPGSKDVNGRLEIPSIRVSNITELFRIVQFSEKFQKLRELKKKVFFPLESLLVCSKPQ